MLHELSSRIRSLENQLDRAERDVATAAYLAQTQKTPENSKRLSSDKELVAELRSEIEDLRAAFKVAKEREASEGLSEAIDRRRRATGEIAELLAKREKAAKNISKLIIELGKEFSAFQKAKEETSIPLRQFETAVAREAMERLGCAAAVLTVPAALMEIHGVGKIAGYSGSHAVDCVRQGLDFAEMVHRKNQNAIYLLEQHVGDDAGDESD